MSSTVGELLSIWRYPVKSMTGEELLAAPLTASGIAGDRLFAVQDRSTAKILTARKLPALLDFSARIVAGGAVDNPRVRIIAPDGSAFDANDQEADAVLSRHFKRQVALVTANKDRAGGFFDDSPLHLLTQTTLSTLARTYPAGRFAVQRFRPSLLVQVKDAGIDFPEEAWIEGKLAIGEAIIAVTHACGRCVMTTLSQSPATLPVDSGILATIAQHNSGNLGVYACVVQEGRVSVGDSVKLLS